MGRRRKLAAGATALVVLAPAAAIADETIEAQPQNRYANPEIEIDQGERVIFRNNDAASHDVTAEQKGSDGKPLFASELIDRGKTADVKGADMLSTGSYPYLCSVHPQMKGTIKVNTNGTPKPRPGQPAPAPPPPAADPNDQQDPTVTVRIRSTGVRSTRRAGVLKVRVGVDEAAAITLRAIARPRVGGPLVTIATGRLRLDGAGRRNVEALLTKAGRRALRKKRRLAVIVTAKAVDLAGNTGEEAHGRTLGLRTNQRR